MGEGCGGQGKGVGDSTGGRCVTVEDVGVVTVRGVVAMFEGQG